MYILLAFEKKWAISDRQSRTGQDTDTGLIFQKSNVMKLSYKQKLFLYFLSGARCDWNFVFARTESQNAQANRNAEAKSAMNQIR